MAHHPQHIKGIQIMTNPTVTPRTIAAKYPQPDLNYAGLLDIIVNSQTPLAAFDAGLAGGICIHELATQYIGQFNTPADFGRFYVTEFTGHAIPVGLLGYFDWSRYGKDLFDTVRAVGEYYFWV